MVEDVIPSSQGSRAYHTINLMRLLVLTTVQERFIILYECWSFCNSASRYSYSFRLVGAVVKMKLENKMSSRALCGLVSYSASADDSQFTVVQILRPRYRKSLP